MSFFDHIDDEIQQVPSVSGAAARRWRVSRDTPAEPRRKSPRVNQNAVEAEIVRLNYFNK